MKRMPLGIMRIGFACLLSAAGCASEQTARQPASVSPSVSPAMTEPVSVGPSDSLKACLAKISDDSSNGVRKIAEQSCQDNEKLHQDVIGTAIVKSGNRASAGTQGDRSMPA